MATSNQLSEQLGDIDERVESAREVSSELSDMRTTDRENLTGVVENIRTCETDTAPVVLLRNALYRTEDHTGVQTDEELKEWVAASGHQALVVIDVEAYETNQQQTLAWFREDFPLQSVLKLAGVDSLSGIIHRNLPLRFDGKVLRVLQSSSDSRLMRYNALLKISGIDDEDVEPFVMLPLLVLLCLLAAISVGSLAWLGAALVSGLLEYVSLSMLWPTDTLYARDLKPDWLF